MATLSNIPQGFAVVFIAGKNVSDSIEPFLNSVTFNEAVENDSDSVEISLSDPNGLWRNAWYPPKGAAVSLSLGYKNGLNLNCGGFELDEIEFSFPPANVYIRAIAAKPSNPSRTKSAQKFSETTLSDVVHKVAADLGLTVKGEIEHLQIKKMTQSTDSMAFLSNLLSDYGYAFNIRDNALNVFKRSKLNKQKPNITLGMNDIKSLSFREKSVKVVSDSQVDYFDPETEALYSFDDQGTGGTSDSKKQNKRVENAEQAQKQAEAAREKQNADERTLSVDLIGNPKIRAGLRFTLTGFGRLDGTYAIVSARHSVSRDYGYTTSFEAQTSF